MVKSEFSEKMYEILLTHELLSQGCNVYVPSQNREGDLGFDALFNNMCHRVILFQYKVSERYERKPRGFGRGHVYKFTLYRNARGEYRQHNLLVRRNNAKYASFYVAPLFSTFNDLYSFSHAGSLLTNSVLISPMCRIYDSFSHYISYNRTRCIRHSFDFLNLDILNCENLDSLFSNLKPISKEEFIAEFYKNVSDSNISIEDYLFKNNIFVVVK